MNISSSGHTIINLCISFAVIDSVAVILRLLAKRSTKVGFAADDAWVVASVSCFYVFVGTIIWGKESSSISIFILCSVHVGTVNSGATLDRNFLGHSNHVILRKVCQDQICVFLIIRS